MKDWKFKNNKHVKQRNKNLKIINMKDWKWKTWIYINNKFCILLKKDNILDVLLLYIISIFFCK